MCIDVSYIYFLQCPSVPRVIEALMLSIRSFSSGLRVQAVDTRVERRLPWYGCRERAAFQLVAAYAPRLRMDPHAARRGGERAHAFAHLHRCTTLAIAAERADWPFTLCTAPIAGSASSRRLQHTRQAAASVGLAQQRPDARSSTSPCHPR